MGSFDHLGDSLKAAIKASQVVTFDVFDTALLRAVDQPVDLFLLLAMEMGSGDPMGFAKARMSAEQRARKKAQSIRGLPEVTLDDIYEELRKDPLFLAFGDELKEKERALELRLSKPHPLIQSAYAFSQESGKRVGFLSDIYLDRPLIEEMLKKGGYEGYEFLLVSSEMMATKAHGRLFLIAHETFGIEPKTQLHIGDNLYSDIRRARALGIAAYPVARLRDAFPKTLPGRRLQRKGLGPLGLEHRKAPDLELQEAYWTTLWRGLMAHRLVAHDQDPWFERGYQAVGLMLLGFSLWLDQRAQEEGVSELFFLARDGHLMQRVHERLKQHGWVESEHRYVYASRRAFNIPAMTVIDKKAIDFLVGGRTRLRVRDYLIRSGLDPDSVLDEIKSAGFKDPDAWVQTSRDREALQELFLVLSPKLLKVAQKERELLKAYWHQEGLFEVPSIGLVDIGWHGSLQDAFTRLMAHFGKKPKISGYYLGTYHQAVIYQNQGQRQKGYLFERGEPSANLKTVKASVELFEWIFSAPDGCILGFEETPSGSIQPLFESGSWDAERWQKAERLQLGALKLIDDLLEILPSGKPPFMPSPEFCLTLLDEMLFRPTLGEVLQMGDLPHSEGFGGVTLIEPMVKPLGHPLRIMNLKGLMEGYRASFWRRGFLRRLWPDAW